ncbi:prepilin-type N-terminal cleavage/methylation domain-containing protein [Fibrobacter sp.]|uniref:prepilin-type N-terminal cleavage/methylation domain-containing protein n=1 Tax=Fibrobacter sp. TaxID=35828 RepID=UPI00386C49C2
MKRGFSLIEVMVVIVVLGVLSGIAVPKIMGYTEKTKEKADLMKLYCLRDALNRALLENDAALYKSSFVSSGKQAADNLSKLKTKLASETGVDLFVIEMRPDLNTNIQNNHASINKDSEMSKLIGDSGTWYDALKDAGFNGVADILIARNNGSYKKGDGATYYSTPYQQGKDTYYRTYPKDQIFMSYLLNRGKSAGLSGITSQGSNKTNYRLTMSFQWSQMDSTSNSVEVALLPAGAKMRNRSNGKGGALLSDNGVCFSTYGDIGCADYQY